MGDWTSTERRIKTPYGSIYYGGACKDSYRNMVTYDATPRGSGLVLTLQRPAMEAFLAAQVRYARRSGWSKQRIERSKIKVGGKVYLEGRPILVLPGTNRSCSTQKALYASDPNRYANPNITGHTRGLAIDRSNAQSNLKVIDQSLGLEGWNKVRPDDEPWHLSFGVTI